jgi:hypothetical protein
MAGRAEKQVLNWKIEALFMAGLSTRQVAREVLGDEASVGRVHRLVASKGLEAIRKGGGRAAHLIALERSAPAGLAEFIAKVADGLALDAGRRLSAEGRHRSLELARERNRAELVVRKGLPVDLDRLRVVPAEPPKQVISIRPKSGLAYNDANCTLSWMGAQGWLTEWAVQGGIAYRRDFHAAGAAIGALDYSKPKVDGGRPSGVKDGALDAASRRGRALGAVRYIFGQDRHLASRLALLDHVAVQDLYLREFQGMPKHLARRRALTLQEALEPIAWAYGYHREGEVAERLARWSETAANRAPA